MWLLSIYLLGSLYWIRTTILRNGIHFWNVSIYISEPTEIYQSIHRISDVIMIRLWLFSWGKRFSSQSTFFVWRFANRIVGRWYSRKMCVTHNISSYFYAINILYIMYFSRQNVKHCSTLFMLWISYNLKIASLVLGLPFHSLAISFEKNVSSTKFFIRSLLMGTVFLYIYMKLQKYNQISW